MKGRQRQSTAATAAAAADEQKRQIYEAQQLIDLQVGTSRFPCPPPHVRRAERPCAPYACVMCRMHAYTRRWFLSSPKSNLCVSRVRLVQLLCCSGDICGLSSGFERAKRPVATLLTVQ